MTYRSTCPRMVVVLLALAAAGWLWLRPQCDEPKRPGRARPRAAWEQTSSGTGAVATRSERHSNPTSARRSPPRTRPELSSFAGPKPQHAESAVPDWSFDVTRSAEDDLLIAWSCTDYTVAEDPRTGNAHIRLQNSFPLKVAGRPPLPVVRRDMVLADHAMPRLDVVDATWESVPCPELALSAGFVPRDESPRPDPRGNAVAPFPDKPAYFTEVYSVAGRRGVGLVIAPFQVVPETKRLRICRSMTLRVRGVSADANIDGIPAALKTLLANRWQSTTSTLSAKSNPSDALLLIVPESWTTSPLLAELVAWKQQRGLSVMIEPVQMPTTATIKSRIETFARDEHGSFVILLGDETLIPPAQIADPPSDTVYVLLDGPDDRYHDLFISRMPAQTLAELHSQLARVLRYERWEWDSDGAWCERAIGIASDEDLGNLGFRDREIVEHIRTDLLDHGYDTMDQIYDLSADQRAMAEDLTTAWNEGRGLICYLGHGYQQSWKTTGFSVSQIPQRLVPGPWLPFIVSAACHTGNFVQATPCLAEALVRAGSADTPLGSIGIVAATSLMDWDPPIVMLQAAAGYLTRQASIEAGGMTFPVQDTVLTAGPLAFAAVQRSVDFCLVTPTQGDEAARTITEQTHLFGDCSLLLRTRAPRSLSVGHDLVAHPALDFTVTAADSVTGQPLDGLTVTLWGNGTTHAVATTDKRGTAVLQLQDTIPEQQAMITVVDPDHFPYQHDVAIIHNQPVILEPNLPEALYVGQDYDITLQAVGGTEPYQWELTMPGVDGLTLDPRTGALAGSPLTEGIYDLTVRVTDAATPPVSASRDIVLTVGHRPRFVTSELAPAQVLAPYSQTIVVEGSFGPFDLLCPRETLPPGIVLKKDGSLSGTPEQAGLYDLPLQATDRHGTADNQVLTLDILPADTVEITPATLPDATRLESYNGSLLARGGTGRGFTWALLDALPPGLTLSDDGTISGIPTEFGVWDVTVAVTDDHDPPHATQAVITLTVTSTVFFASDTLPDASACADYDAIPPVNGSAPPFTVVLRDDTTYRTFETPASFEENGVLQPWQTPTHYSDLEWHLDLPFSFPFNGRTYNSCRVGNNGYLIFGSQSPAPMYEATQETFLTLAMIAPFWTDMVVADSLDNSGIWVSRSPESVSVRWRGQDYHALDDISPGGPLPGGDWINCAVTLASDGTISFSYGHVQTSNRAIVGFSCPARANQSQILLQHAWNPANPAYVTNWAYHDTVTMFAPVPLPDWITLNEEGRLVGTPPGPGTAWVRLVAQDAQSNLAAMSLPIEIWPPDPDENQDGDVDNLELLDYAATTNQGCALTEHWHDALTRWQNGSADTPKLSPLTDPVVQPRRSMQSERFLPGGLHRIDVSFPSPETVAAADKPLIVCEELPDGWIYQLGSAMDKAGHPLPDPRRDGRCLSWIVDAQAQANGGISYAVTPAADDRGQAVLDGWLVQADGSERTGGTRVWWARPSVSFRLSLTPGWNFIALPLELPKQAVPEDLQKMGSLWRWRAQGRAVKSLDLKPLTPYWIFAPEEMSILIDGFAPPDKPLTLQRGWNAFGVAKGTTPNQIPAARNMAWTWDGQRWQIVQSNDTMMPGRGYLVMRY